MTDTDPGQPRNAWLTTEGVAPIEGLHAPLRWEPYLHVGDGYKSVGYRRADGAGYVLPEFSDKKWALTGRWWTTWAHPLMCERPGWHHHAFGTYSSAQAAAFAFDAVYELERIAGNADRCRELRISALNAAESEARTNPDFKTDFKTVPAAEEKSQ